MNRNEPKLAGWMGGAGLLLLVIFAWSVLAWWSPRSFEIFPTPAQVGRALMTSARSGELWNDLRLSMLRVGAGFGVGAMAGYSIGLLTGRIPILGRSLGMLLHGLRPIPVLALISFAVLWLGLGEGSRVALIAWGSFFPVWLNTHLGASHLDRKLLWVASSLGASRRLVFRKIVIPASFPHVVVGLRAGMGVAWLCLVAAEMTGASAGLGYRIDASHMAYRVDRMVAFLVVLGALGCASDLLFARLLRSAAPWFYQTRS